MSEKLEEIQENFLCCYCVHGEKEWHEEPCRTCNLNANGFEGRLLYQKAAEGT